MVSPSLAFATPSRSRVDANKQSRDCVNERVAGAGGGGGTCYNCGEAGHMVCSFSSSPSPPLLFLLFLHCPLNFENGTDISHESVPNHLSPGRSEANVTTVVNEVIK